MAEVRRQEAVNVCRLAAWVPPQAQGSTRKKSDTSGRGTYKLSRTGAARRVPSIRCNRRQRTPSPQRGASGARRGRAEYRPPRFRSSRSTAAVRVGPRPLRGVPLRSPLRFPTLLAVGGPDSAQLIHAPPARRHIARSAARSGLQSFLSCPLVRSCSRSAFCLAGVVGGPLADHGQGLPESSRHYFAGGDATTAVYPPRPRQEGGVPPSPS